MSAPQVLQIGTDILLHLEDGKSIKRCIELSRHSGVAVIVCGDADRRSRSSGGPPRRGPGDWRRGDPDVPRQPPELRKTEAARRCGDAAVGWYSHLRPRPL